MPIVTVQEMATLLPRHARVAGLDVGSRTVGLAISDLTRTVASPGELVRRTKFRRDAEQIKRFVERNEAAGLIFGLPISMDGTEGPRCQSVRDFATNLLAVLDLPATFWDERLSTAAVQRILIGEADMTRKRRAEVVDKAAAAYILQGALDALAAGTAPTR